MAEHETDEERDRRFETEEDLRTVVDAARIQKDGERMKAVKQLADEQRKALGGV